MFHNRPCVRRETLVRYLVFRSPLYSQRVGSVSSSPIETFSFVAKETFIAMVRPVLNLATNRVLVDTCSRPITVEVRLPTANQNIGYDRVHDGFVVDVGVSVEMSRLRGRNSGLSGLFAFGWTVQRFPRFPLARDNSQTDG
jgi:hypothetical protein